MNQQIIISILEKAILDIDDEYLILAKIKIHAAIEGLKTENVR